MANFDPEILAIVKRLQTARMQLMKTQPFYALLLMHIKFALNLTCETAYTDGERIAFNPDFMKELDDQELQFVLMHEVLHVVLQHCFRHQSDYEAEAFDIACDIVVNSNIMHSFGDDVRKITLRKYGEMMHLTPEKQEGYLFSAEEVYEQILARMQQKGKKRKDDGGDGADSDDNKADAENDGTDSEEDGEGSEDTDGSNDADGSDAGDSSDDGDGDALENDAGGNNEESSKDGKEKGLPGGKQGKKPGKHSYSNGGKPQAGDDSLPEAKPGRFDDHSFWEGDDEEKTQVTTWINRLSETCEIIASQYSNETYSAEEATKTFGWGPMFAQRFYKKLSEGTTDWRTILQDFVQEEINDYSFSPPDRRFSDSDFFLPDYNEKEESVKNIWFLIDTSGSISNDAIGAAYSEICSAIEMYNGKLQGWLSFTESYVTEPIPFTSVEDILAIKPVGGGGNDFSAIFVYLKKYMMDDPPAFIIIITDGYDAFPEEKEAMGIPVLWLINNEDATPPWGKLGRIDVSKYI